MLSHSLKTGLLTIALISSMPFTVMADTQSSVVNSSAYTNLDGSMSRYKFPDGKAISVYPSVQIGVSLTAGDYTWGKTTTPPMVEGEEATVTYLLKLTPSGQAKVDAAFKNVPASYAKNTVSLMGQFAEENKNDDRKIQYFNTGVSLKKSEPEPDVKYVTYTAIFTDTKQTVTSQTELAKLKKTYTANQKKIQQKIGVLTKAQQTLLNPSVLTVSADNVNNNVDVKTAQSQSKTKIVNLNALKQAKAADKIDKEAVTNKKHVQLMNVVIRYSLAVMALLVGILGAIGLYKFNKRKNK